MAGVFDIDIHDPDMGNNVDLDGELESDDDVIEVEVRAHISLVVSLIIVVALPPFIVIFLLLSMTNLLTRPHSCRLHLTWSE